ncbi:hypothetical protein WK01_32820 [Burkholderia cepacia]|nr:hypothetical protein WK01_32820 [Burkholderia cepacia]
MLSCFVTRIACALFRFLSTGRRFSSTLASCIRCPGVRIDRCGTIQRIFDRADADVDSFPLGLLDDLFERVALRLRRCDLHALLFHCIADGDALLVPGFLGQCFQRTEKVVPLRSRIALGTPHDSLPHITFEIIMRINKRLVNTLSVAQSALSEALGRRRK